MLTSKSIIAATIAALGSLPASAKEPGEQPLLLPPRPTPNVCPVTVCPNPDAPRQKVEPSAAYRHDSVLSSSDVRRLLEELQPGKALGGLAEEHKKVVQDFFGTFGTDRSARPASVTIDRDLSRAPRLSEGASAEAVKALAEQMKELSSSYKDTASIGWALRVALWASKESLGLDLAKYPADLQAIIEKEDLVFALNALERADKSTMTETKRLDCEELRSLLQTWLDEGYPGPNSLRVTAPLVLKVIVYGHAYDSLANVQTRDGSAGQDSSGACGGTAKYFQVLPVAPLTSAGTDNPQLPQLSPAPQSSLGKELPFSVMDNQALRANARFHLYTEGLFQAATSRRARASR